MTAPIQQVSDLDEWLLSIEKSTRVGHVSSVLIVDPSTTDAPWTIEGFMRLLAAQADRVKAMTHRLEEAPLDIDLPYWVRDDDFDLSYHVRHVAVPGEQGREEFADLIARIHSRPLDRRRPLWEITLIDGLGGSLGSGAATDLVLPPGCQAVMTKIHLATVESIDGMEILSSLIGSDSPGGDTAETPTGTPTGSRPRAGARSAVPEGRDLIGRTALNLLRSPRRLRRAGHSLIRSIPVVGEALERAPQRLEADDSTTEMVRRFGTAPPTPFNREISAHRRCAFASIPLDDVRNVREHTGTSVNDVLLAVVSTVVRDWLIRHDELPDRPLAAMVPLATPSTVRPISTGQTRNPGFDDSSVTSTVTTLATHIADPAERLRVIHASMNAAKVQYDAVSAEILADATRTTPPAVVGFAARLVTSTQVSGRALPFNLVVSNIPATTEPMHLAGAAIVHNHPMSAIVDGVGLNISITTTADRLDFTFVSDRDLITDLWTMADAVPEALAELRAAQPA